MMELNPEEQQKCFELMAMIEKAQASLTNAEALLGDGFIDMARMSIQQAVGDLSEKPKIVYLGELLKEDDQQRKLKRMEDDLNTEGTA